MVFTKSIEYVTVILKLAAITLNRHLHLRRLATNVVQPAPGERTTPQHKLGSFHTRNFFAVVPTFLKPSNVKRWSRIQLLKRG